MSDDTPRDRINSAFERELSQSPTPAGLRARAIQEATAAPHRQGGSRAPQLLAMVAALLAIALIATLVAGNRLLHSVPGVGMPRATVARTASPAPSPQPIESVATPGTPPVIGHGGWLAEPSLPMAVARFTPVLLPDGKVLIAGGVDRTETGGFATSKVEIFDPATGRYTQGPSMSIARASYSAIRLPSGKVLVAGGYAQGGFLAFRSAEIYDPGTGTWSSAAPMHYARTNQAAVLLPSGKVFVTGGGAYPPVGIGGQQGAATATMPAEIYDPATDSWSIAAKPSLDRPVSPTATLLRDGRVLVVGGQYMNGSPDEATEQSEIYDPTTDRWTSTAPETRIGARQYHVAVLLPDGRVLVAGGMIDERPTSSAVVYDPATDSWAQLPNMNDNRCPSAQLLLNGRVLVFGGACGFGGQEQLATVEEFDPASNRWQRVAGLSAPRAFVPSVLLGDGNVLAIGGISATYSPSGLVERFVAG